jgi:hypothetical protein
VGDWPGAQTRKSGRRRKLPAIPAVAAISAIAAASATATATTLTAVAAASTAASVAAPSAATRALGLRAGFVDHEVPATKVLTVQASHGAIGIFITGNFDEGKTAGLARETVTDQTDCRGAHSQLTEPLLQLLF